MLFQFYQLSLTGADPGFQVRGGALKNNLRRAEGGANIFGVFRVKIHDFTQKKSRLQNLPPTPNLQF